MRKVIYFDESSALDLIDIKNNGRSQEIMEKIVKNANNLKIEGGFGTGLLDLLTTGVTGGIKGAFSRNKESIMAINITNTILTSFLEILNGKKKKNEPDELLKIQTKSIEIIPESATYIKVIAPFTKIFKEITEITPEMSTDYENIDFHAMDDVLANAKGYYELVATDNDNKKYIVRFNLEGFRNNYRIQDLQRMRLTLYGVVVGNSDVDILNFQNELDFKSANNEDLGFDPLADPIESENYFDIIDIILAGVE